MKWESKNNNKKTLFLVTVLLTSCPYTKWESKKQGSQYMEVTTCIYMKGDSKKKGVTVHAGDSMYLHERGK